jgi:small conductance mechanosensitive channel
MDIDLAQAASEADAFATMAWAWAAAFLPRLAAALVLFIAGAFVAGWLSGVVTRMLSGTGRVDNTIVPMVGIVIRYTILILVLIAALGQLGVQTTSLLAVLGAAGLAIGLALQGTLANIAAGIMLLYLRPFRVGDYIETPTVAGTVNEIGLFVTHLETPDGLFFFAPNSELWNKPLRNFSRNPRRMMTITFSTSYDADPAVVRRALLEMAEAEPRILKEPPPIVSVESYLENRIVFGFRAWTSTANYPDTQRAIAERIKQRLQAAGIKFPASVLLPLGIDRQA